MLKINLSDKKGKKEDVQVEEDVQTEEYIRAEEDAEGQTTEISDAGFEEGIHETPVESEKKGGKRSPVLVVVILIVVLGALVYIQKDTLLSLIAKKPVEAPVVTPAPTPPPPEPEAVPEEPDLTFVALNKISEILPPRIWFSRAIINYDGSYEINGIAFTHASIGLLVDALGSVGNVTVSDIPQKSKSSETVYRYKVSGKLTDIEVPEILDIIPTDDLVELTDPVVQRSKEFGVIFKSLPKSGQSYGDTDLPFVLEGSYDGLKKVIGELCPEGGDNRIYQIVILPATMGRPYDKIKASFSLRTSSSI